MKTSGSELLRCGGGPRRRWRFSRRRRRRSHNSRPRQSAEIGIRSTIRGEPGAPPHYAVPDFIALTTDKETVGCSQADRARCCGTTCRSSASST